MQYKISVSGASHVGHCCENIEEISEEMGKQIVLHDCVLVTGATTGVPYFAAKGAKKAKGFSVGFSPAISEMEHEHVYNLPTDQFDVMVYTGFDYSGRNLLMTRASDAVVVICGRMGTLNEFTIAFEDRKPIGVLIGTGGTADLVKNLLQKPHRKGEKIIYDSDPKSLIERLIVLVKEKKKEDGHNKGRSKKQKIEE